MLMQVANWMINCLQWIRFHAICFLNLFAMQDLKREWFHFAIEGLIIQHKSRFVLQNFMDDQSWFARLLSGVATENWNWFLTLYRNIEFLPASSQYGINYGWHQHAPQDISRCEKKQLRVHSRRPKHNLEQWEANWIRTEKTQ